eukprot:scaffold5016_cov118-Isochrysis_galbana.AAC.14
MPRISPNDRRSNHRRDARACGERGDTATQHTARGRQETSTLQTSQGAPGPGPGPAGRTTA